MPAPRREMLVANIANMEEELGRLKKQLDVLDGKFDKHGKAHEDVTEEEMLENAKAKTKRARELEAFRILKDKTFLEKVAKDLETPAEMPTETKEKS